MSAEQGLSGLWAHLLDENGLIERQVRIVRAGPPGYWLVENFSWIGGDPTTVSAISQSELLDESKCVLYLDDEAMRFAYEHGSLGHQTRQAHKQN